MILFANRIQVSVYEWVQRRLKRKKKEVLDPKRFKILAVQLEVKLSDSYSPVILIKWPLNSKTVQMISWEVELGCQLK